MEKSGEIVTRLFLATSNHIHAGALHFIEQGEAEKDDDDTYRHTDTDLPEVDGSLSHEGETEGLNDEDHGVKGKNPAQVLGHRTERIGDATGIHPELHEEAEHDLQVTEARRKSRNQASNAQTEGCHLQDQDRQYDNAPTHFYTSALNKIVNVKRNEQGHLHGESDEVGDELRDGNHEAREVNFIKNAGICGEGGCGLRDAALEIAPADGAGEKEEHRRGIAG